MTKQACKPPTNSQLEKEIQRLEGLLEQERNQLREAQETLEAIRTGAVDGIVRSTPEGEQVFILKGSDQPYRNLIEEMKEGALLISESGNILYSNMGFAGIIGAPLDKVIGTHISSWVSARNIEVLNKIIAGNNTDGKRVFEIAFQNAKHQLIPAQVSISRIALDSINASALIITDLSKHMEKEIKRYTANLEHEITERKKAEERISWLASFPELNPDPVIEVDFNGKVMYSNKVAKNLFPDLDNLGINHPFIFHISSALPALQRQNDRIVNLEILARGHWYAQRMHLVPNSCVIRIFGANIDGRKKVEQALMKAKEDLEKYASQMETLARERAEKLKDSERLSAIGQVAGMVGHDIRNPLQAIVSELYCTKQSLAETKDGEDKETIQSLDFIEEQVDYINKIVVDLQDFAKPLRPEFIDVEICDFIVDALKGFSIPDDIEAAFECEKGLPPLRLDRTFMTRILTNLATNAIQAMPKGGKLTVKVSRADKKVNIVVEDTGVGIPDEIKSKMFTPLFTTKAKGQGFGLPVVKRLVEAQGGNIAFESKVGKGTKFIITLPLNR